MNSSLVRCSEFSETYQGLSPEALYTSDEDLKRIFQHELVRGTWVDLGAGDGRTVNHYARTFSDRKSIGIELDSQRVKEGHVDKPVHAQLIQGDLLTCEIPEGDTYFFYFPTGPVLDRILSELAKMKRPFRIVAIESHGDFLPRLDLENWLTRESEIPLTSPRHYPHAVIFETNAEERSSGLLPFTLSFIERYLLIREGDKTWIGDSKGLEWHSSSRFTLLHPPRTIDFESVDKILTFDELDAVTRLVVRIRERGEVKIVTEDRTISGFIRKIHLSPGFSVEISSGETIEWQSIKVIQQGLLVCFDSSISLSHFLS